MLYVITEDTNSGRVFWKAVFETFLKPTDYQLIDFDSTMSSDGRLVVEAGNTALDGLVDNRYN